MTLNNTLRIAAVAGLTATGCLAAESGREDPAPDRFAAIDDEIVADTDGGIDPDACLQIEADVADLLDTAMTCHNDNVCDVWFGQEVLADSCLPQLQCYVAVSNHADVPRLAEKLRALDQKYRKACGTCPVATCMNPDYMRATCEGACELGYVPPSPIDDLAAPNRAESS